MTDRAKRMIVYIHALIGLLIAMAICSGFGAFVLFINGFPNGEFIVYTFVVISSFGLLCVVSSIKDKIKDVYSCFEKVSEHAFIEDRDRFKWGVDFMSGSSIFAYSILSLGFLAIFLIQLFHLINHNPLDFSSQGVWVCGNQMNRDQIFFRPFCRDGSHKPVLVANKVLFREHLNADDLFVVTKDGFKISVFCSATLYRYRVPDYKIISMVNDWDKIARRNIGDHDKYAHRGDRFNYLVRSFVCNHLTRMIVEKISSMTLAEVFRFYPEEGYLLLDETKAKAMCDEFALDWDGSVKMVVTEMPVKN